MSRPKKGQEHPREELKPRIKLMAAIGIPRADMAGLFKMSLDTLCNKYREELDFGSSEANTVVGGKIFEAAKRGEQWACTLWAARRMGWRETSEQIIRTVNDPADLADNDLADIARSGRAGASKPANGSAGPGSVH